MALSPEANLIDTAACAIRDAGGQLNSSLPQVASALFFMASNIAIEGQKFEKARIESIITGTHQALIPIKRLLRLQALEKGESSVYLSQDLALVPLRVSSTDEVELCKEHMSSDHKKLFKRFLGAWFRRVYAAQGVVENDRALRMFKGVDRRDIPYGRYIQDGNLVVEFEDSAKAFSHTLIFGKHYLKHDSDAYTFKSLWLDETITGRFEDIGWLWLQQYVMAPVCVSFGMTLADFEAVLFDDVLEQVKAIEDVTLLHSWNNITLYYPGDETEFLPPCRVTMSYHHYIGCGTHKLVITVYPDTAHIAFGLDGLPQGTSVDFTSAPTPIQKWIKANMVEGIEKVIIEVKEENEKSQ